MAINDAVSAYAAQAGAADQAYKDAWANTPTGGAGQFGGAGVFENASKGLSATAAQNPASTVLQTKPLNVTGNDAVVGGAGLTTGNSVAAPGGNLDALPTTPTASASTDPIKAAIETTSNFSRESPYVSDVTDAGDVGRQAARPDRLLIDDTMSADEQYRRAWQNESNGFYGNTPDATGKAPSVEQPAGEVVDAGDGGDYYVEFVVAPGDDSRSWALLKDKKTGKVIDTLDESSSEYKKLAPRRTTAIDRGFDIGTQELHDSIGWHGGASAKPSTSAQQNASNPNAADAARQIQNTGVNA